MAKIRALGYLVVRGPLDEWEGFAREVLGLEAAGPRAGDELRFRADDRAYRLIVREAAREQGGLVALGFELGSDGELEELAAELGQTGHAVTEDADLARARDVRRLFTAADPDGNVLELYYGPASGDRPFVSPQGARFVTGAMGVGHVFLACGDLGETLAFYRGALGFALSDTIDLGPATAYFLHCNPRHHSVAVGAFPGAAPGLGHLMLETDSVSAVGLALDRAEKHGAPVSTSIGEHTNDLMTSFYVETPSGFQVEFGCHGRTVDDATWTVGHYSSASSWGHKSVKQQQPA